jgi:hypothetical protein
MTQRPRAAGSGDFETNELGAAQPARDQKRQDVALVLKRGGVGRVQKLVRLLSACTQLVGSRTYIFNNMHVA